MKKSHSITGFEDVVKFHGHSCPGLAIGYRAAEAALKWFDKRAEDEELVAIVENDSCAVDAVQVMTGCTFGKGNLLFRDYGKQVYTFVKRPSGESLRVSLSRAGVPETKKEKQAWERYIKGDRSEQVLKAVSERKIRKTDIILNAPVSELFKILRGRTPLPPEARIYPSVKCEICGEQAMEPRARIKEGMVVCMPCFEGSNEK